MAPDQFKVQSRNFSPHTRPTLNPTYSLEWVTLNVFSSAFMPSVQHFWSVRLCSCQAEWLWPIANLKSLMCWNQGLLQVQNIRFEKNYLGVYKYSCSCVCPSTKSDIEHTTEYKTVELRFVWNNHAFQSSLLFHLTTFLSTGEFFFKIELLVLPQWWPAWCHCCILLVSVLA